MANWKIWPIDRCVNRLLGTQVTASSNASLAAYVADSRQVTSWVSGTTSTGTYVAFDFGSVTAYNIGALALGNIKNADAVAARVYQGNSAIGQKSTLKASFTIPAATPDILVELTSTNSRYMLFDFNVSILATLSIGTASFLDSDNVITFDGDLAEGPQFPIMQPIEPGFVEIQLASGDTLRQTQGGPIRRWILNLTQLAATSSSTYNTIRTSLNATNGWINGIWLTPDDYNVSTNMRAYYCRPSAQSPIQMGVTTAGPYGDVLIELVEFQRGPV